MNFISTSRPPLYNPKIGQKVEVDMKSGKIAIFEVYDFEWPSGVDWMWIDLKFDRYLT